MQKRYIHCPHDVQQALEGVGGWVIYDTHAYKKGDHFPYSVFFPDTTVHDECYLWLPDLTTSVPRRKAFIRSILPEGTMLVEPQDTVGYIYLLSPQKQKDILMATKEHVEGFPHFPYVTYHGTIKEIVVPGHTYKYGESRIFVNGSGAGKDEYTPIFVRLVFDPVEHLMEVYSIVRAEIGSQSWLLERTNRSSLLEKKQYGEMTPYLDLDTTYGIDWQEEIGIEA